VFHTATLRRHPELVKAVEALTGRLDDTAMQRLNAAVDLQKQPVEAVVRRWRVAQGLAPPRS
jgi:glycine betaine/choline ABC-type transport system substrate-binding protein